MISSKRKSELCLKCMECCKELVFMVQASAETVEFYKARKLPITMLPGKSFVLITVPHVCDKLTTKGCGIYANRPLACKAFNGSTHPATKDICLWNKEK